MHSRSTFTLASLRRPRGVSGRPGRIAGIVEVELPQPRTVETRELPEFAQHVTRVRRLLRSGGLDEAPEVDVEAEAALYIAEEGL